MTARPRGVRLRSRAAAGCLAGGLALSPIGLAAPAATALTSPADVLPVTLALTTLRPIAPQPGDTLVLKGTVTNISAEPVSNLTIELRMGSAISARSTFDAYADDPTGTVADLPITLAASSPLAAGTLAAGQHESFSLRATMDPVTTGLPTSSWQVRALGIAVSGDTGFGAGPVGNLRTFLPWAPRQAVGLQPLDVAWLWPLVDRPHRDTSVTWGDDDLAGELKPDGRLGGLLAAAAAAAHQAPPPALKSRSHHKQPATARPAATDVPVTWAIDPMLLDDVEAMRGSYQVAHSPKPTAGTGSVEARAWLTSLRDATTGADTIPLPYGDPDVAAAVRNGLSTLVGVAATSGKRVIQRLLPGAMLLDAGWPPGGLIDQRAVDALFSDGATSLVLSDSALPPVIAPNETPSSLASLVTAAGPIPTTLSDSILSTAISEGAETPGTSRVTLQRYLGETLMIEAEAPSYRRSILIAPARRWDPSPTLATDLLADTGKVPWLSSTTVGSILAGPPDTSVERQPLTYPSAARHAELPPSYVRSVAKQQRLLSQLTAVLPPGDAETRPFSTALLRALSSAWRGAPGARQAWLNAFSASLHTQYDAVHIVSAPYSTVTLTGHGGKVPVTIANNLSAPASITIQLENAGQRLTLPHHGRVSVAIPANRQTTVDVHATAKTSGVFPLTVQLLTPNGQKYGTPVQLYVRSTVYGTITLVITGAATAALLVAVGIRLTRRALATRRAGSAPAP
ncbi:MAG TPA: DUF6049 family protein [Mycobacteriales bacterium]|nr:DUF6049 family protein [Mycobacteriales bacterium]